MKNLKNAIILSVVLALTLLYTGCDHKSEAPPISKQRLNELEQMLSSNETRTRARAAYLVGLLGSHAQPIRKSLEKLSEDKTKLWWSPTMIIVIGKSRFTMTARGDDASKWMGKITVGEIATKALHRIDTRDYTDCKNEIERMIMQLSDKDWDIRWHAAETLGNIDDKRAIEPLTRALEEEKDSDIQEIITDALEKLTKRD